MIVTRLRQISLLLIAMAISALAFIQMFQRTAGEFPMQYAGMLALAVVLFLVLWGLIVRFQPYASQSILPCVLLLTATGVTMIARIDQSEGWAVAQRQLIWLCIAIVLSALLIIFLKDYRVLRRFSYVSMVVGLVLLLAPMLPFAGQEVNGARIWIRIPGLGQFQPGEFAKITVILLDAVKTGAPPGTVVTRSRDELPRHFSLVISPHQIGMKEVLGAAQLCGTLPRIITLVGVEAGHTDFCQPMSAEVREAVPQALDLVETLIARALEEYQARKDAHA